MSLPCATVSGVLFVTNGGVESITVKLVLLVAVTEFTATEIVPVVAPVGTVVVILVAVEVVTTAVVPLNFTILFAGAVLKFVPVIVTVASTAPLNGLKLVMVGGGSVTVKLEELVAVRELTVTEIAPVVAPVGTVVVILVAVEADTVAAVPLKLTLLLAGVALKFVPVMVIVVPTTPLDGLKLVIVGEGRVTVKFDALVAVKEFTMTETVPVVAPAGTVVVILVAVEAVTTAVVPLNFTTLSAGVAL